MEEATSVAAPAVSTQIGWDAMLMQRLADYLELTKPRILIMILLTASVAMLAAGSASATLWVMLHAIIGTGLVAGSASAMNQVIERNRDRMMPRTSKRPLASQRITVLEGALVGSVLLIAGLAELAYFVNLTTAALGLATWFLYVAIYTPMKMISWLNTAVGTVPGAMPVLMGWTAVGGSLSDVRAWLIFSVVLLWQFPHFMAIAWLYREQYAMAGYQMLTTVDPTGRRAGFQGLVGAIALIPISYLAVAPLGWLSVSLAILGCLVAIWQTKSAYLFRQHPDQLTARKLLRGSLLYLPAMLALLVLRAMLS